MHINVRNVRRKHKECGTITVKERVQSIFEEYDRKDFIRGLVLTSKNGIPVATSLDRHDKSESFSALSATILGASEVIFSSFDREDPEIVNIRSGDTILLIKEVDSNTVLALLGDIDKKDDIDDKFEEIVSEVKEVII